MQQAQEPNHEAEQATSYTTHAHCRVETHGEISIFQELSTNISALLWLKRGRGRGPLGSTTAAAERTTGAGSEARPQDALETRWTQRCGPRPPSNIKFSPTAAIVLRFNLRKKSSWDSPGPRFGLCLGAFWVSVNQLKVIYV